jgi:hypothetical protein
VPASAADDPVIFKDGDSYSIEEQSDRMCFNAGVLNTVSIEKIVSIVGK